MAVMIAIQMVVMELEIAEETIGEMAGIDVIAVIDGEITDVIHLETAVMVAMVVIVVITTVMVAEMTVIVVEMIAITVITVDADKDYLVIATANSIKDSERDRKVLPHSEFFLIHRKYMDTLIYFL